MADLATLPARLIFHSRTNFFYPPFSFLALIALQDIKFIKKYWAILTIIFLAVCIISLDNNITGISDQLIIGLSTSILHLLILFMFLKELINSYLYKDGVSIFVLVLIFYEVTIVAKFLDFSTGFLFEYTYYIIATSLEIIIGIFFIIFKSDDKRLILQSE